MYLAPSTREVHVGLERWSHFTQKYFGGWQSLAVWSVISMYVGLVKPSFPSAPIQPPRF